MTDDRTHLTGDSAEDDATRHKGVIRRAVDAVVGDAAGDKTDPRPVRGWEQPAEEQQPQEGKGQGPY